MKQSKIRFTAELESRLMLDMLRPVRGESVLEIGCGTGTRLCALIDSGLQVTGLDPSPYMLDIASRNVRNRVDFYRGVAEDLPFEDNSFDNACIILTLEFVDDFKRTIEEACRVAKNKVFIGFLNKHAVEVMRLRLRTLLCDSIYKHARFFSISELKSHIRYVLGNVPVTCRTVSNFSSSNRIICRKIEQYRFIQRFPFGAFAGMVVVLNPQFITRPLSLICPVNRSTGVFCRINPDELVKGQNRDGIVKSPS
ncbi:MAG: class I SAM-dependent methyltransferase [Desulfobacterales bacterium]|nr:class I SAM-dependent methyltransferase [Desulfobacterales bacterium]